MKKLTEEELQQVNDLRNRIGETVSKTGQISIRIELLTEDRTAITRDIEQLLTEQQNMIGKFKALLTEEDTLVQRFLTQYGAGSIDFDTGEFTPEK